jgi:hypothetical protein
VKPEYTLVYLPRGAKVAHVLPPNSSPNEGGRAVCGRDPSWPDSWFGTGTQDEWDKARILPCCVGCAAWLRQNGS